MMLRQTFILAYHIIAKLRGRWAKLSSACFSPAKSDQFGAMWNKTLRWKPLAFSQGFCKPPSVFRGFLQKPVAISQGLYENILVFSHLLQKSLVFCPPFRGAFCWRLANVTFMYRSEHFRLFPAKKVFYNTWSHTSPPPHRVVDWSILHFSVGLHVSLNSKQIISFWKLNSTPIPRGGELWNLTFVCKSGHFCWFLAKNFRVDSRIHITFLCRATHFNQLKKTHTILCKFSPTPTRPCWSGHFFNFLTKKNKYFELNPPTVPPTMERWFAKTTCLCISEHFMEFLGNTICELYHIPMGMEGWWTLQFFEAVHVSFNSK